MPLICETTCSAGTVISWCTSSVEAAGNGMNTFAIVTLICGSSSFGMTNPANTPRSSPKPARSGVRRDVRNVRAIRPDTPSPYGVCCGSGGGVMARTSISGDRLTALYLLARVEARQHLDPSRVRRFADANLAQARLTVAADDVGRGKFA